MSNVNNPTVHVMFSKKSNSIEKDYFATGSNKNNNNGDKNYNQNPDTDTIVYASLECLKAL